MTGDNQYNYELSGRFGVAHLEGNKFKLLTGFKHPDCRGLFQRELFVLLTYSLVPVLA